jgi:hypothetical protein
MMSLSAMFASIDKHFSLDHIQERNYAKDALLNQLRKKSEPQLPSIKCSILTIKSLWRFQEEKTA